ncbi:MULTISPECIES: FAD-binding protein [unclassified Roseitalea]|uniref:FAD-binding protein n=1 Tax=unclassified Roseitalea TaxID=2639107 RepID=UPI00273F95CA|nr:MULTISPECIES: FAD-binding protein [unclassified Roseitalea]
MAETEQLTPQSEDEACAMVAEQRAGKRTLAIAGAGSKAVIGQPTTADATLSSTGLRGIVEYNPEELVIVARAGTPLAEIEAALAGNNQMLAFAPPDWGRLLDADAGQTIGGVAATNLSGSRRLSAGAARDALLGVRFVNGRGEAVKSGGRVMKNVTGLDLVKLMAGSWGALGLITEVAFKVLPRPASETTLLIRGADDAAAARLMARAMATSAEVSAAAHLPARVAETVVGEGPATLLRLEGFADAIAERIGRLEPALETDLALEEIGETASRAAWAAIGDGAPFADGQGIVWRISAAPMAGHAIVGDVRAMTRGEAYYDWQGGLIWLRLAGEDPQAALVRGAVARNGGGHATLIRAPEAVRAQTPTFQPEAPAIGALSERIRASIDPDGVFNCGRRSFQAERDAA